MDAWGCAVRGCGRAFEVVDAALAHQVRDHEDHECRVCGTAVPAGFFAIRHALREHTRAEYVRHYGAGADEIRRRERVLETVEDHADPDAVVADAPSAD